MSARTRCLITAFAACHLLAAHSLVTSQLLSSSSARQTEAEVRQSQTKIKDEDFTATATRQEMQGSLFKLQGNAEIEYGAYILHADEMTYNSDTGDATADGHVILDGGPNDEHVEATPATRFA